MGHCTTVGRAALAALATAVIGALAPAATAGAVTTLPAFYSVPAHIPAQAGAVIKTERISTSGLDASAVYRIMYVSETIRGAPVAVTGIVYLPRSAPPAGGYPVVTSAHGTVGMADICAPSLTPRTAVRQINLLLAQGWLVTSSDYQGLGTPGLLPYLVGDVAARNTIDIVRAARHVRAFHASDRYIVWGHSEGGLTAMFALHIGAAYAPDLQLMGVVAGAPPSELSVVYQFLLTSPYRFYVFMVGVGYEAAYGPTVAPLSEILTKRGFEEIPVLSQGCFSYLKKTLDRFTLPQLVKVNPFSVPAWRRLIEENDPSEFTTAVSAPLLIYQGGADEQIPVVSTQLLATQLCAHGQDVERWIYPGRTHDSVIPPAAPDFIHWMADRLAGQPSPDPYLPVGQPGVMTSTCS